VETTQKCLSTNECINNVVVYTMKPYLLIKRNKIMIHTTRMNLENIMLRQRNQSQKPTFCMFPIV
jgi:hypothetical protein